jgi:hypothetical protein
MNNSHKSAVWFWSRTAVAILFYVVSLDRLDWLQDHYMLPDWGKVALALVYFPIRLVDSFPASLRNTLFWYLDPWPVDDQPSRED